MAKNQYQKYIWILNLLMRKGALSYNEINDEWQSSVYNEDGSPMPKRTFDEYKKGIEKTFDINIACNVSKGYKYYIEDAEVLRNDSLHRWLLSSFSVENMIKESKKLRDRIMFEQIPSGDERLLDILDAMREDVCITVSYQSFREKKAHDINIKPYILRVFKKRWYLIAENEYTNDIRTYALDRMSNVRKNGIKFDMPTNFSPTQYFKECFGIMVERDEYDVENIKIKVEDTNNKREYFRTLPLHESQQETEICEDYSIFSYKVMPSYDFIQEILSHGAEVEILEPLWLRLEMKERIKQMLNKYKKQM